MYKNVKCKFLFFVFISLFSHVYSNTVGPWNLDSLYKVPEWKTTTAVVSSGMTSILYESIDYLGEKVEVFAYYAAPAGTPPEGGWPAAVFAHGGGGTAYPEAVEYWNEHGYAAISMDNSIICYIQI